MQDRNKPSNLENVTQALQNLISLVLGLIAFLSAGGFIVVNSHLARFTDIHAYNISPRQYLAAGVGLLIPPLLASTVVFLAYYTGRFLGALSRSPRFNTMLTNGIAQNAVVRKMEPGVRYFDALANNPNMRRLTFTVGIVLYTLVFGSFYGAYVYGSIPYYLGGGRPETIVLVFKDAATPVLLGLAVDSQSSNRTQTVLMLAQLEDGWLVADTNNGRIASVRGDVLSGIVDNSIQPLFITPTATVLPTAAISPTPTP